MWLFFRNRDWKLQPGITFSQEPQSSAGRKTDTSMWAAGTGSVLAGMMGRRPGRWWPGRECGAADGQRWEWGSEGVSFLMPRQCSQLSIEQRSNKRIKYICSLRENQQHPPHYPTPHKPIPKKCHSIYDNWIHPDNFLFPLNYNQMIAQSILLLLLAVLCCGEQTTVEFQIRKRHPKWSSSVPLGKLTVRIFQEQRSIESEVEAYHSQFLTEHDFEDDNPIIVEFIALKTNSPDYADRLFITAVDEINSDPHGQKIAIVAGADPHHLAITAINYVQTRERVGEIFTEVLYPRDETSSAFSYAAAPPKNQQEEESFFSKYKWPLIIGGVLLFTMSSGAGAPDQAAAPRT